MTSVRIVLADTHLGFDYPVRPRVERRRRGPDFFENFQRVLDYARKTHPDLVLHGGDLFFRAKVPSLIVDMVYADLFEFAGEGIPLLIVPGNHERSILPASLFLEHPNLFIFDRPRTFSFDVNGSQVALSGFPCRRKDVRQQFSGLLAESGWHKHSAACQLLCLHQTVEGATVGPTGYTFRSGQDVIPRSRLPQQAAAVLSGHIHRQQVLKEKSINGEISPPVVYPGSIERTSFAEKDERKGFYEIIFVEAQDKGWQIEKLDFHELPARPMLDITLGNHLKPSDVGAFIREQTSEIDPDAIIRLRCEPGTTAAVKSAVTSSLLREKLPETMNYQFSSDFHPARRG
jgi:exonuclease SbcD